MKEIASPFRPRHCRGYNQVKGIASALRPLARAQAMALCLRYLGFCVLLEPAQKEELLLYSKAAKAPYC